MQSIPPKGVDTLTCGLDELDRFDDIIDVRTPSEFADDHLPGAVNAPVLSDAERVRIGTMYKQESAFRARRLGAALVARHIAQHLETAFADRPRNWQPLIYCWRGGKRSESMAAWFNMIGWKARQLEGGYKTWRRHVMDGLDSRPGALHFIVLTGPTGCGKTRLLHSLARAGAQTLDLEGLACHRGSLLGELPDRRQPGQRGFETALYAALERLDPARPVFVEAESRRIGRLDLPTALMQAMHAGRCVRVQAQLPRRIAFLLADYAHLFAAPDDFKQRLAGYTRLHGHKTVAHWQSLVDDGRCYELFQSLMQDHYDPAYRRSSRSHYSGLAQAHAFDFDPTAAADGKQARALIEQLGLISKTP